MNAPSDSAAMATQEILGWLDKVIAQKGNITVEETFDLATKVRALLASPIAPPTEQTCEVCEETYVATHICPVMLPTEGNEMKPEYYAKSGQVFHTKGYVYASCAHPQDAEAIATALNNRHEAQMLRAALRPFSDKHEAKAAAIGGCHARRLQARAEGVEQMSQGNEQGWSTVAIRPSLWWRLRMLFRPWEVMFCWDGKDRYFLVGFKKRDVLCTQWRAG